MTSPRQIALQLLDDIFIRRRNFDEAMTEAHGFDALEPRDRAFVRVLVATVLKRTAQIDAILAPCLNEPMAKLKPNLLNIFRLGIAQIIFLKTPPHAAVSSTVDLAAHQKPLVNAVMRRLTREPVELPNLPNTPAWLWDEWVKDYGTDTARAIVEANLGEAPLDISVKNDAAGWAKKLDAVLLPTGSLRKENGGFIPDLPGFDDGGWWVQNAAAALPATLFGDLRGKTVIDLCAAPGGKTAQLAAQGALVTALDRSAPRLARLHENMERLKLKVGTVNADAEKWMPPAPVDAVLLDAPCTATGTIRHQPDLLHLKTPEDQQKLAFLQRRLLKHAATMLKPGGTLVYCTCSLQKAEGEEQTDWILSQGAGLELSPITTPVDLLTPRGEIRALPCHWQDKGGLDGFYVARFRKDAS